MEDMQFTGERFLISEVKNCGLYYQHVGRYLFARLKAPGKLVLDAACGTGYGTAILAELGLNGISGSYREFFFNSIFCGYGHRFIWSAELMAKVLKSLGYGEVRIYEVGQGSNEEYCIERRRRGLYLGNDWREDRSSGYVYDIESQVVEARK